MSALQQPPQAIADLAQAVRQRRRARMMRNTAEAIASILLIVFMVADIARGHAGQSAIYLIYPLLSLLTTSHRRQANERDDALVSAALSEASNPKDVPLLLDAMTFLLPKGQTEAWARITDLLPRMAPAELSALTPVHFRALAERLAPAGQPAFRPDPEYRRALLAPLDLLTRTTHTLALPQVESLLRVCMNEEVRTAARACRVRLLQSDAAATASGTLLRPAEGPTADADRLLRASEPAPGEALLRAADRGQE